MISLWPVGPDQSMNSGSGRVSGFSNRFAKWDVSTGAGQGKRGKGDASGRGGLGWEGGNDFMTTGC